MRQPHLQSQRFNAVLLDVDGTLVDSNEAHARAWIEAFAEHGFDVSMADVRRAIGMGGDHLMPKVARLSEDSDLGRAIAARRSAIFSERHLPHLCPFRDSDRLVAELERRGFTIVAASSAKAHELRRLLEIAGVAHLLDASTSQDDAESSKPDPDIIQVALERAGADAAEAILIGDTPYDVAAARAAGVATIAFRSGGWKDHDLEGATAVYDGPWDLLQRINESPLGDLARQPSAAPRPAVD